jgi:hypothetical protein
MVHSNLAGAIVVVSITPLVRDRTGRYRIPGEETHLLVRGEVRAVTAKLTSKGTSALVLWVEELSLPERVCWFGEEEASRNPYRNREEVAGAVHMISVSDHQVVFRVVRKPYGA